MVHLPRPASTGLAAALWLCSCASTPTPQGSDLPQPTTTTTTTQLALAGTDERCIPPKDASTMSPEAAKLRDEALRALDDGRAGQAKHKLEEVLKKHPGNYATSALLQGANASIEKHKSKAGEAFESIKRLRPTRAPDSYQLVKAVSGIPNDATISLTGMRQTRNNVTDTHLWFQNNGLALQTTTVDKLPAHVPQRLAGSNLEQAIDYGDHTVIIYGQNVAVLRPDGAVVRVFDLTIFNMGKHRPQVKWAQAMGGVLYVMAANPYYANESDNKNAYVSALDLSDGSLRWRSHPLVGNATNFVIAGGFLISGYGFTSESDNLFVLERATGRVAHKISLTTKPEIILRSGDKLYVRGYDADVVFNLALGGSEAPARAVDAGLKVIEPKAFGQSLSPSADDRCRVDAAMVHLDHGRYSEAAEVLWKVGRDYKNAPGIEALRELINTAQAGATIDLQVDPVVAQTSPSSARHPALTGGVSRLVQKDMKHNGISDTDIWLRDHGAGYAGHRVPNQWTGETGDLPRSVPLKYGPHDITAMMDHGDHLAIIYGGRFVALAKGGRAMSILDVTLLMGTESVAIYTAIMQPDPAWVQLGDGVAYLGNGMANYYAPGNSKGRIHAVDTKTGALLWQSAADVSNMGFVIVGPHIISGYGVHGQTSALHVIERDSGKTISKTGLGSPPSFLVVKGSDLYVRTYDRDYVFAMR